jgi:uncharacterized protein YbjT (DUF2867 family)
MSNKPKAVVFDCAELLGEAIAQEFLAKGFHVIAGFSDPESEGAGRLREAGAQVEPMVFGGRDEAAERTLTQLAAGAETVVFSAIGDASYKILPALERAAPKRCLFVSANDAGTKSVNARFSGFASGEARVTVSTLPWTILRPTMTYGHADDFNLSVLAQRLKSGRKMVVVESEEVACQPIHFQDVARAAASLAVWDKGHRRVVPLGGPDRLSIADLYDAVAEAVAAPRRANRVSALRLRIATKPARLLNLKTQGGISKSGRILRPRSASTPIDIPNEAWPKIDLKTGLELLAKDLSRLDGTPEGAQLAERPAPELPL